jgi:nucleotide-binding universal stress UspA family protein
VGGTRQRIVVGIDGSAGGRAALFWALTAAANRRADVEVVTAFPIDFYWADAYLLDSERIDAIRSDTEARARAMVDEVRHDPALAGLPAVAGVDVDVLVVAGAPAEHLVQRSDGAALLVVGSRGRGAVRSTVAGSVALHCSTHARCTVVVVHPVAAPAGTPARVVVGLDNSEHGRAALAAGLAEATLLGARLDAVLAFERPSYWSDLYAVMAPPSGETREHARTRAEALVTEVLGPGSIERGTVHVTVAEGHPDDVLAREAEGAQLLVVAVRSRSRLTGVVLGSVALQCVMHAPCPVLVVHPRPAVSAEHTGGAAATPATAAS